MDPVDVPYSHNHVLGLAGDNTVLTEAALAKYREHLHIGKLCVKTEKKKIQEEAAETLVKTAKNIASRFATYERESL